MQAEAYIVRCTSCQYLMFFAETDGLAPVTTPAICPLCEGDARLLPDMLSVEVNVMGKKL